VNSEQIGIALMSTFREREAIRSRIPSSSYRLQLNNQFSFKEAADLVEYLHDLGISDCYTSPFLSARAGSLHGYDITDHSRLNPEIGGEKEFARFAQLLKDHRMGLILDLVPNHMCIAFGANQWWNDVLENGPSSPYARFFDIDWLPPKPDLAEKVLLPMLGEQYGRVLENQELKLEYDRGSFHVRYYETRLPISPRSYTYIIDPLLEELRHRNKVSPHDLMELESIITALRYLPPRSETDEAKRKERQREKEVIKRRLDKLIGECKEAREALQKALSEINGEPGAPRSFNRLERLLADQGYRLSYWRVAADEINYRRFFDINELAAIRVEEPEVFAAVHRLIFQLMRDGRVTGLRIDHVDGLFDPVQYLNDLQAGCIDSLNQPLGAAAPASQMPSNSRPTNAPALPAYIVVEKILGHDEILRPDWLVHGTTGYGFMNLLNGVFVDTTGKQAFQALYERFTGQVVNFSDLVYESKKLILRVAMSSELTVLARKLDRISEQQRFSRDFTFNSLQYALGEVIASFPIYRTYTRLNQKEVNDEDQRHICHAIRDASQRNPAISRSLFDFIGSLLLLNDPEGLSEEQIAERRNFVLRFQQLTGPVMAKGMEDTAFYRYFPLASLNEVGGDPARFGITVEVFHDKNRQRMCERPHGLSATSTHDTKRSEDVRARLNVLSEMPAQWYRHILHWQKLNQGHKTQLNGMEAPDANDEYLIYQTLVGAWPLSPSREVGPSEWRDEFHQRIEEYIIKAIREAKVHSSWISPNEAYEHGVRRFIRAMLEPEAENRFLNDFVDFQQTIALAGMFNSLSQTLLKITLPGVPDFYQGTEIWDFSLVDPDNRRLVDFTQRRRLLAEMREIERGDLLSFIERMMQQHEDGRIKMYLMQRALNFRRAQDELFVAGDYQPLQVTGSRKSHAIAFSRTMGNKSVLVATGRFFSRLGPPDRLPIGRDAWNDTAIVMEKKLKFCRYRNVFTGEVLKVTEDNNNIGLPLACVFSRLPVALLELV
jgi:(1->4)-alpha-D-glucan 1-alpha-D-glucosylmutase